MGFPSTFDDALLFVLSVLFREIFIWQLLRLVLTYNFTDCDFEKIKMDYRGVILIDLNSYMIGVSKETCFFKCVFIRRPDCLTKIEHLTFHPTHGCQSLAEEIFAMNTNATLTHRCPGYSGIQVNTSADMYDCYLLTNGLCRSAHLSVWVAKAVGFLGTKD
uniref:Thymic stromal lymphopoietin n=1 Tax=Rhinolophus ferrumequinum TaxID=59479 RepID=A0A671F0F4_RHIFE